MFKKDIRSLRTEKDDKLIRLVVFGYEVYSLNNNLKNVDDTKDRG